MIREVVCKVLKDPWRTWYYRNIISAHRTVGSIFLFAVDLGTVCEVVVSAYYIFIKNYYGEGRSPWAFGSVLLLSDGVCGDYAFLLFIAFWSSWTSYCSASSSPSSLEDSSILGPVRQSRGLPLIPVWFPFSSWLPVTMASALSINVKLARCSSFEGGEGWSPK